MSDLFKNAAVAHDYSAKDIEVLEGLEPVRKRPGMYIGGTDERALHHLVAEILDNSMDEAVAGHASRIELELHADGSVTVKDNGRGIPVDPHPKFPDKSALEVILTTLHSGAKFGGKSYETSGGLHGVGMSVVNALSEKLIVEVATRKRLWRQEYSKGTPLIPLQDLGEVSNRRGTTITFFADPEIFGPRAKFKPETLYKMARSKAYLFKGVEIRWKCAQELLGENSEIPEEAAFRFPGGIKDFLEEVTKDQSLVIPEIFAGEAQFDGAQGRIEWAITWPLEGEGISRSYCNTVVTPLGGTHENGFRNAVLKSLRNYGELTGNKRISQMTAEDCMGDASFVISAFIRDPQFQGQTKEKLVSVDVTRWVENAVKDRFDHWLTGNTDIANELLEYVLSRAEERLKRKQTKDVARASATRRLRLPGKLADCSIENANNTEIFLVEGDSAGGSAKQARDRKTQAILPLRGKILNVANASEEKFLANKEISDMILALGCGIGDKCDISKLRYERVVIMTDADVDGAHIASLLITFFFQHMRPIVEAGRLFLTQPPLYRMTHGAKSVYAQDDAHRERLLQTEFKNVKKIEVSRFKGLGEMPAKQLKDTTMDPMKRTLIRVTIPANDEIKDVSHFVMRLMGKKAEERFLFIQENAPYAKDLDI